MISYKRFNISILFIIPIIFLFYFLAVYFFYFDNKDDSFSVQTYFKYKDSIAQSIPENKILSTSGSNNFLGIRSYKIQQHFTIPTVNLSIHAGLKTEYILERVKRLAKKGDIIIVPLEYNNLTDNGSVSIVLNKYLLSYDKDYFKTHYTLTEKLKILSSISILDLFYSVYKKPDNEFLNKERKQLLKNLNSNGDMLNMNKHNPLKTKKPSFRLPVPFDQETKALKAIKNFNDYCKKNNIHFYMTFPNIVKLDDYKNKNYKKYFRYLINFFKNNNIKVIGKPEDAMYPQKLFFDSEYHMISRGSEIRTKDFIEMLDKDDEFMKSVNTILKIK